MPWPLSQDYNEAIQSPDLCLADADLRQAEAKCNAIGIPMPRSGNFADVYEMTAPGGKKWALKCFTRQVAGLRERYAAISAHLKQANLPFMVDFTYLEQGIKVKGQWYPALKMEWVEGLTLNEFVKEHADQPQYLEMLSQIWQRLARRLREARMAHADLQHGNVLLVPGAKATSLGVRLIDYDGMFVPALANSKSGEVGHPAYQHPQRLREGTYSAEVDRFPHLVIYTALRSLMVGSRYLWNRYDNGDNLLFRQQDLDDPDRSPLFLELLKLNDPEVHKLVQALAQAARQPLKQAPLLDDLMGPAQAVQTGRKSEVAPAAPAEAPTAASVFAEAAATTSEPRPRPRPAPKSYRTVAVIGGAAALLLVGGVIFALNRKPRDPGPTAAITPARTDTAPKKVDTPPPGPADVEGPGPNVDSGPTPEPAVKNGVPQRLVGHTGPAVKVVISPDGKLALSCSGLQGDKTIRLWDLVSNKELRHFELRPDRPFTPLPGKYGRGQEAEQWSSVAFSSDGKQAVAANYGGLVVTWNVATGQEVQRYTGHQARVSHAVFAPDNQRVLSGSKDGELHLWDAGSGKLLKKWKGHTDDIRRVAFLPDGQRALSGGYDQTVKLWDLATQTALHSYEGHGAWVQGLAVSRDGKWFVAASQDVFVWDVDSGKLLRRFNIPKMQGFTGLALAPDQRNVVTSNYDHSVRVWDVQSGKQLLVFQDFKGWAWDVAYSPDGQFVLASGSGHNKPDSPLTTNDYALRKYPIEIPGSTPFAFGGHKGPIARLVLTPDGQQVLSCSGWPKGDNSIRLWDVASGKQVLEFIDQAGSEGLTGSGGDPQVKTLAISADGSRALSGHTRGMAILWDLATGKELRRLEGHRGPVHCLVFTPDGRQAITGGADHTIRVWDLATGKQLRQLQGHNNWVRALAVTPDGKQLLSGSRDKLLMLWDLEKGEVIRQYEGHSSWIEGAALTRDGKTAVSVGDGVRVWDVATGRQLRRWDDVGKSFICVAISPDDHWVAASGYDRIIRVWDLVSGQPVTTLYGHRNWVWDVVFTPDGKYLLSGGGGEGGAKGFVPGSDFAIRRWDLSPYLASR